MVEEDEVIVEESNSLAEALGAAWDEDQGDGETGNAKLDGQAGGEEGEPKIELGADPITGEKPADPITGEKPASPPADAGGVPDPGEQKELGAEGQPGAGAPVSWNATNRELWKDIPKAAQDYIIQREQEFETGIQQYAQNAQRAQGMDKVLQPYGQYFAMNGGAGQTISQLLQTGASLQMGSPVQKAQQIAQLINNFGVDIPTLDNLLVGKAPAPGQQQASEVQQAVATAMQPFQQYMNTQQQGIINQQQVERNEAGSAVEQFAKDSKNEFYRDVSSTMADLMDMAANRGINMTMEEAYSKACLLSPEVSKIQTNRTAATAAANKRKAGSSIRGNQGGPGDTAPPGSMREAIEHAWDTAGQQM